VVKLLRALLSYVLCVPLAGYTSLLVLAYFRAAEYEAWFPLILINISVYGIFFLIANPIYSYLVKVMPPGHWKFILISTLVGLISVGTIYITGNRWWSIDIESISLLIFVCCMSGLLTGTLYWFVRYYREP